MKRVCYALWFAIFSLATYCHAEHGVKLLVFVIANDQEPIYVELQKIWRSYMHLDPEHIDAYFIKADPYLDAEYKIEGDVIRSRTEESIFPGILNKTLLSLEAIGPKLDEYDYFLRTNLSSFYVFPRLLDALKNLPKNRFCFSFGIPHVQPIIISGAGYILSQDVAKLVLDNKHHLMNVLEYDDMCLGRFLISKAVPLARHERMDLLTLKDYFQNKKKLTAPQYFQFRTKNPTQTLRLQHDIFIQKQLLKIFYNIHSEE